MPRSPAQHRKPSRFTRASAPATSRHRKPKQPALKRKPVLISGTTVLAAAAAAAAITIWPGQTSQPFAGRVDALTTPTIGSSLGKQAGSLTTGTTLSDGWLSASVALARVKAHIYPRAAKPSPKATPKATPTKSQQPAQPVPAPPVYLNPLRSITGLMAQRIDMGADFGGTGPIYAIGDAVITNATGSSAGWPGGGWITYQLTDGSAAGLQVYVAEDVTPTVVVGQHVTSSTVIANMYNGGAGIETGWAMPDGSSAESQLAAAGGVSGGGPFPTAIGINFDALLQALGVPAAPNAGQSGYGVVPSNYPTDYSSVSSAK